MNRLIVPLIFFGLSLTFSLGTQAKKKSPTFTKHKTYKALATEEIEPKAQTKANPTWTQHAATIAPIQTSPVPFEQESPFRVSLGIQKLVTQGHSQMDGLENFELGKISPGLLTTIQGAWHIPTPNLQWIWGPIANLSYGQQDGVLPNSKTAQNIKIRFHQFTFEAGLFTTWTPFKYRNFALEGSTSLGQLMFVQSSSIQRAQYSNDQWLYSFEGGAKWKDVFGFNLGLCFKNQNFFNSQSLLKPHSPQWALKIEKVFL